MYEFLYELFKIMLSLSLSGSILILLLLLLRPLSRNRLSWRWQYYIWLLVIARLLLPLTPQASVTGNLFRHMENRIAQSSNYAPLLTDESTSTNAIRHMVQSGAMNHVSPTAQSKDVDITNSMTPSDNPDNPDHAAQSDSITDAASGHITEHVLPTLCALWLVIALLMFMRKVTIYQSFIKYVNAGSKPVDDIALLDRFGQIIAGQHVHGSIDLRVNSLVSSPLLIGFRHACMILPTTDLSADDFYHTVLHELTHYRRRDMFYKWLVQITVCLHWFNPLVYLMEREINWLCELSCDERVISTFSDKSRKAYGETLLNAIGTGGNYKDAVASVTLHESKNLLKGRLEAIMSYRKMPKWIQISAVFLTGILIGGAAVLGAYAAPVEERGNQSASNAHKTSSDDPAAPYSDDGTENILEKDTALPDYTITYEDDIYYIMVDGADEDDKPLSNVTSGCKKLVIVRKDEYATLGPFAGRNMPSLAKYVKRQCQTHVKNGSMTQENAALFLKAAEEIQNTYTALENGSVGQSQSAYYYTQNAYYEPPYIIFAGYNLPPQASSGSAYSSRLLTLSDGSTLSVSFSEEAAPYIMTDENVIPVITALIERIRQEQQDSAYPVEAPFISSVEYVGDTKPNTLAEKYYLEDTLPNFTAIFPVLDSQTRQSYLDRMFADDQIGFFSCCLPTLHGTETYDKLVEHYLRKAYETQNTSFFATLAGMLNETDRKRWLEKCKEDGNSSYYYILRKDNENRVEETLANEKDLDETDLQR